MKGRATIDDVLKKHDKSGDGRPTRRSSRRSCEGPQARREGREREDIAALVAALDDDGGGSLSIDELVDFVERGKASFA